VRAFLISSMIATCLAHLMLFDLISSVSIKCGKSLTYLSDYIIFKEESSLIVINASVVCSGSLQYEYTI
jgi:hypothetical protein